MVSAVRVVWGVAFCVTSERVREAFTENKTVEFPQKDSDSKKLCEQRVQVNHRGSQGVQKSSLKLELAFGGGEECNG